MRIAVLILLLLQKITVSACSVDEGPLLGELIHEGVSVVILTPVEIVAPEPSNLKAVEDEDITIHFYSPITAKVRVVEVLLGKKPSIEEVTYINSWCGGHRLEVDRYYVLAVDQLERQHNLALGGNELLGLGDEYLEEVGANKSDSVLIRELVNYRDSGMFKLTSVMLRPYREITMPDHESPSERLRR